MLKNSNGGETIRTLEEMKRLYADKGYTLLEDEYHGNKVYMTFEKDGYLYYNTYNGFMKTDNPKKWSQRNPYSLKNLQKWIYDNGGDCVIVSEKYDNDAISLKCKCGNLYTVSLTNLLCSEQFVCPSCGKKRAGIKHRRDEVYLSIVKDAGLRIIEEYVGCKRHYYMLTKDGYYVKSSPYNIRFGADYMATVFDERNKYSIDNMKHWIELNCPDVELLSEEYTGAKDVYKFKCSCGNEFATNWQYFRNSTFRCPICSNRTSSFELKTENWLKENFINYEAEKVFPNCKDVALLRFDFFLPDKNIVIEVDGEQHFRPVSYGGISKEAAELNFVNAKRRDKIKDDYCADNGIKMARIPYTAFQSNEYKNILKNNIYG